MNAVKRERDEFDQELNQLHTENADLKNDLANMRLELEDCKAEAAKNSPDEKTDHSLPDAADLLNQVKRKLGKKAKAGLADIEAVIEILEG